MQFVQVNSQYFFCKFYLLTVLGDEILRRHTATETHGNTSRMHKYLVPTLFNFTGQDKNCKMFRYTSSQQEITSNRSLSNYLKSKFSYVYQSKFSFEIIR